MSPEEEALGRVVTALDRHGIPYMVTGSVATSYHGRPRATHDADVVVDPTPQQLDALVADLEAAGFYVNAEGAREAFSRQVALVTPEDAILTKLEWSRAGDDSERQLRDAAGVLELNPSVDRAYIARWARDLGVSDLWDRLSQAQ